MKIGVKKKAELKKNGVKGALFACSTGLLLVLSACAKEGASPAQAGASVAISQAGVSAAASSVDASKETQQTGASEAGHPAGVSMTAPKEGTSAAASPLNLPAERGKRGETAPVIYQTDGVKLRTKDYAEEKFDTSAQLKEMMDYWAKGNMKAVEELAHLSRFEAMSASMKTESGDRSSYYGEVNEKKEPEGKGIMVYSENRYYYGSFQNGRREGKGTWIQFYPSYSRDTATYHSYSGEFKNDLPNGQGQEHYEYNPERMDKNLLYLQNVIGTFQDGFYQGEMYVITLDHNGKTTEWKGACKSGTWQKEGEADAKRRYPVLHGRLDEDRHIWMTEKENRHFGVREIAWK